MHRPFELFNKKIILLMFETPQRRSRVTLTPKSIFSPRVIYPDTTPFGANEKGNIEQILRYPIQCNCGFDVKALNYRNSHITQDMRSYAETEHDNIHGYGHPGAEAAYCALFLLFRSNSKYCNYNAVTGPTEKTDKRISMQFGSEEIRIAYRSLANLLMHLKNYKPMQHSVEISHALDALVRSKCVFYIDYARENHDRILCQIHDGWNQTTVIHRDFQVPANYFMWELADEIEHGRNSRQFQSLDDTSRIMQAMAKRKLILNRSFVHVTKDGLYHKDKTFGDKDNSLLKYYLIHTYARKRILVFHKETILDNAKSDPSGFIGELDGALELSLIHI